jgi:hypothetical protein
MQIDLEQLRHQEQAALAAYTEAHNATEAAIGQQVKCTRARANIVDQIELANKVCTECEHRVMQLAADGDFGAFRKEAGRLQTLRTEADLLERAVRWHDAWPAADAERSVRVARVAEQTARHCAEVARKDVHEHEVLARIAEASAISGGLTLDGGLGPISAQLAELVEQARRQMVQAQKELEQHDVETRELHIRFKEVK